MVDIVLLCDTLNGMVCGRVPHLSFFLVSRVFGSTGLHEGAVLSLAARLAFCNVLG